MHRSAPRFSRIVPAVALVASVLSAAAMATTPTWVFKAGPEVLVRSVRIFASMPSAGSTTLFTATEGAGVIKVVDNGTSATTTPLNNGLPHRRLRAIGGFTSSDLYVATETGGVYKTSDGGANWAAANGSGGGALGCLTTRSVNARSTTEVWVGTACRYNSGIWRTTDGGANWSRVGTATIPDDAAVGTINIQSSGTVIIAATATDGIFRSGDSGANWTQINNGLPAQGGTNRVSVSNVQVRASASEMLASVEGAGVYLSTDSGANWTASNAGLPNTNTFGIFKENNTTFYVGVNKGGVYRSTDGGANWSAWGTLPATGEPARFARGVFFDGAVAGRYYVTTFGGLMRTADSGATYSELGMGSGPFSSFNVSADGRMAYLGVYSLFRTPNLYYPDYTDEPPATVFEAANGLPGHTYFNFNMASDPDAQNTAYASIEYNGLYKTTDAGANWTKLVNLSAGQLERIRVRLHSANSQTVLAGLTNPFLTATGGGIQRSLDGGNTWTAINNGLTTPESRSINRISTHSLAPNRMFAATAGGVYRTTDNGANWSLVHSANDSGANVLPVGFVVGDPTNANTVYIANDHTNPDGTVLASSGILKSIDAGTNWSVVLPGRRARQVRAEGDGTVIALLLGDLAQPQLMHSHDGGATWQAYDTGIPANDAYNAGQMHAPSYRIVAFVSGSGAYTLAAPLNYGSDFNNDMRADVFWRDSTGGLNYQWQVNGFTISAQGYMPTVPTNWSVAALGDANADGRADVLWRESTGLTYLWLMNGLALSGQGYLPSVASPWTVAGMGDADGDGRADVVWRNPSTGQNYLWLLNGLTIGSQAYLPSVVGTDWEVVGVADYSGDMKADVLWRNKTTGQNYLWTLNGLAVSAQGYLPSVVPTDWEVAGSPDANGDGRADVLWRNKITGQNYLWLMNAFTVTSQGFLPSVADVNWKVVGYGDYSGDGKGDVLWRHATNGQNYLWTLNGIGVASQGYLPSVAGANWQPVKR